MCRGWLIQKTKQRRRLTAVTTDLSPLPSSGIAPLLRQLLADYAATGLPPAYLSTDKDSASPGISSAPLRGGFRV